MSFMKYKQRHPEFDKRKAEADHIINCHPDRIPIICERSDTDYTSIPAIEKNKYLVPTDITCHQFSFIIRERLKLPKDISMWLWIEGKHALKGGLYAADGGVREQEGSRWVPLHRLQWRERIWVKRNLNLI